MFYRPDLPVTRHLNHLPHWQQESACVFITWRLADSVPKGLTDRWKAEREEWLGDHPEPWSEDVREDYHRKFSSKLEEWMDQGMGKCVLREPRLAAVVAESLSHFDGERYLLDSFVVMPNHVHVLFQLLPGFPMEKLVQSWKRYSARRINELRGEGGQLWHKRYWDTLVRGERHFWKVRRYIRDNPAKAKLREDEFVLYVPWEGDGSGD
ncbi:MAG: transposase [Verrucomicrobiota bacterium]